jgi:hypothetical protein
VKEVKFEKLMAKYTKGSTTGKIPTKVEFYGGVELTADDPNSELMKMISENAKDNATFELIIRVTGRSPYPPRCAK